MKKVLLKSEEQIANIREAGKYLTELLELTRQNAKPGVALLELEKTAERFLRMHNLEGAFKGYEGFPANLCLSVNDCIVHGIPDETVLKPGDLLKIDLGVIYEQGIADAAVSTIIGGPDTNIDATHLINTTKKALDKALPLVTAGRPIIDYANAIRDHISAADLQVIKNLTGHGVGEKVHEGPYIYNWPHHSLKKLTFQEGMVVALEPITAQKSTAYTEKPHVPRNLYTLHGDLGAQREYTVAITSSGPEVLAGIQQDPW